jgi:uncharacterized membrane protein YcaP (DUF421 family)
MSRRHIRAVKVVDLVTIIVFSRIVLANASSKSTAHGMPVNLTATCPGGNIIIL